MQKSARVLGQEYGLTAEEMNRVLHKHGYIEGKPGDYSLTEKAQQYAIEKDFHRGTGGYPTYNKYWTTRTFDDSIKDELDVTPELVNAVKDEIASSRTALHAAKAAARAEADAQFIAKQAVAEVAGNAAQEREELIAKWKKTGEIGLIICVAVAVGYGIYKVAPRVKAWWDKRHQENENDQDIMKDY